MLKRLSLSLAALVFAAGAVSAAEWKIDRTHSSIGFQVRHMVVSKVPGNFTDFTGTVQAEPTADGQIDLAKAQVSMTVQTASINTENENRDEHLKSADFFDAATHPELTFTSTKIVPLDGGKFQLVGNLTMRGVTKEVTFDGEFNGVVTDPRGNTKAGFSARGSINRQDFGVSWSKALDNGGLVVSDNVDIIIELAVVQVKPEAQQG
jgi:polyisoprenoid-binding protein YceI